MKWYPLNSVNMTLESRLRWLFGNSNFNRQLYSFIHTYNYNIHDGFHQRIEEPNQGWGRDTNLKKVKEKKKYFTNSNSCRKIRIIVWIKLSKLQCELQRECRLSRSPELVKFKLMHDFSDFKIAALDLDKISKSLLLKQSSIWITWPSFPFTYTLLVQICKIYWEQTSGSSLITTRTLWEPWQHCIVFKIHTIYQVVIW